MVEAEKEVEDSVHTNTNIPIVSLYGHGTGKKIVAHKINDLDVLIFDMQDSGMRHFTYISTLLHAMRAASQHNKHFVVCDRPNPLGLAMEGPLVDDGLKSFISIAAIPVRHGMTVGELATFFNTHELKTPLNLSVIKMSNYNRRVWPFKGIQTPLSPGLRNEKPVPPRPFCTPRSNCEYHDSGRVHDICAPTPLNPSGPNKRPCTIGASAKSQAWGWTALRRPKAAKNCPAFNCKLNGRLVVCRNASSTSTSVSLSLLSLKTMLAKPSK